MKFLYCNTKNDNSFLIYNVQICETLCDNEGKTLSREFNSLKKINDNYEKMILIYDNLPVSNEEGIII